MFGPRFHLFTLFGFPIYVDLSWFIIAILITWSLAEGWFAMYPEFADRVALRWGMGVAGALGLFASIVLHELGHAKVAQTQNVEMRGITLFIFGGVAEMGDEPPTPKAEFLVAIGGPLVSVAIAVLCLALAVSSAAADVLPSATAVLWYVGIINVVLVVFNMIPAFPLDGGRVLRSILWGVRNDLRWATRITSRVGAGFGIALMVLAVFPLLAGNLIAAIWWFLIGMFLHGAARMSYQQLLIRRALEGEPIDRFMSREPITVAPDLPLDQLIEDYVYRYHHKMFPVVEGGRLRGCITINQIREVPRDRWPMTRVRDVVTTCGTTNTIGPNEDAMSALARMRANDRSRLMVVEGDRLVGIVSLKDLMNFLALRVELEEYAPPARRTRDERDHYDQAA